VLQLSEPKLALLMQHYGEAQQRAHELRQELLALQAECAAAKGLLSAAEKSWSAERSALLQSRAEMGDQWDSDVQLLQG
jgi:predicted  nucleic acid-binding Zn-ribbon protein